MSLLSRLFPRKQPVSPMKLPSREETAAYMRGRELDCFSDTVVQVIESKDLEKRFVILRSDHGYYKTVCEEICVCDEDELTYLCHDRYPAWWAPVEASDTCSLYGTQDDALYAIMASPIYRTHFL